MTTKLTEHIDICVNFLNEWYGTDKLTAKLKPEYKFSVYNLDTKEVISDTYTWRYGYDHIKIKNFAVAEYYKAPDNKGLSFISFDLDTKQPKEFYKTFNNIQVKYIDGKVAQKSAFVYETLDLPWDFLESLKESGHITPDIQILCYGYKPYGRIIEYIDKAMIAK